jgi:membrane protease YdiL (CAAX protease family)
LFGIGLILLFTIRLSLGFTSLPLVLTSYGTSSIDGGDAWRRTKLLVLYVVTPLFILPSFIIAIPMIVFPVADPRSLSSAEILRIHLLQDVITSFATIGIAMWISGAAGRKEIKRWLDWFNPVYVALSLVIPFGLGASFSVGRYVYDYVYWGAHNYGHFSPPVFTEYFGGLQFSLLWLVFAAFAEEFIFRALIQPRMIQRYGMWRGLFLAIIVWSAYHFYSDFNWRMTELNVLAELGMRLFVCTSLGFVLGWLTLRSGSIWPAVIAHASYNIILYSGFAFQFQGEEIVRISLWAILAFVLFRYWPVQIEAPPEDSPPMLVEA